MSYSMELLENTPLINRYLPLNIFRKSYTKPAKGDNVCHLHWHDHLEIIIMIKGNVTFYIDSKELNATVGDIFFVNSGQLHVGYAAKNHADVEYIAIVFNKSLLMTQIADPWYSKFVAPFLDGTYLFPTQIDRKEQSYALIKKNILDVILEVEAKSDAYEFIVKSKLFQLIAYIFRFYQAGHFNKPTSNQNIDLFKPLISYIQIHYAQKITIEQAAKLVNLSPFYFCKIFKKITGRTFIDVLNMYRIEEAVKLLKNTDWPITLIAEKVGCGDANYFGKVFRKYKNITPSECRDKDIV